ncbi:MAG: hypothetical protein U9R36_01315, partial [Elusimicrobiota bacterium]|nr:hypothetical protein [Elusimicrobiota bacterium]
MLLVIFSSIPRIFTSSFKNINREEGRLTADYIYTPYGETVLHNKNGHYECSLNHALLFKSPDTELVQETVHMSMLQYPWAEKILVVGGNRTLVEELLRYPNIKNIYWSAIVPGSFDFISVSGIDTKLPPPDIRLRKIKKSDPRDFIRDISGGSIFDVAIVNVPDPVNIFFNRYYSYDFFINLRSIMSDYSIISFDLSAPEEFDGVEKKILFSSVYNSAKDVFPNTLEMEGARIQVLA